MPARTQPLIRSRSAWVTSARSCMFTVTPNTSARAGLVSRVADISPSSQTWICLRVWRLAGSNGRS